MPYVTDTHAIIWYMTDNYRLPITVKKIFEKTDEVILKIQKEDMK